MALTIPPIRVRVDLAWAGAAFGMCPVICRSAQVPMTFLLVSSQLDI
jgi:hypothetical protein